MKKKVFSLMMTLLLAFMGVAKADELTVNDGTATNSYVPVYGFYADAYLKCEFVQPAADLAAMNGATINGVTFYASQTSVNWGSANFQVFLTEVANTSISDFAGPGTVVYEGALSISDGEMAVTFTTPYTYNGGNLLIGVYNTVEGTYVASSWYGVSATGAAWQGYNYSSLTAVSGSAQNFLPKMTFDYTAGGGAMSGEITVHEGTTTNSYVPVYGFYADAYLKSESVYPASELSAMNGGSITSMKFYSSTTSVSWGAANFQVFLTEVANTTISSFNGPGTVVYEGALSIDANGEMLVNFTTPYQYNGGNLLVGVYNTVEGSYVSCSWLGEAVTGASYQGYNYSSLEAVTGSVRDFLPQTTFAYTISGGGSGPEYVLFAYQNGVPVDTVKVGPRPNGYWMEPFTFQIHNDGPATMITNIDWTPNSYFTLVAPELPVDIDHNEDKDIQLTTDNATNTDWQMVAIYGTGRTAAVWNISAEPYDALCPDVWELACEHATSFPFVEVPATAHNVTLYDNYDLPFDEIPEGYDAVYKLVFNQDVMLNAEVTAGADGKVALYTEDFYGEGGPMAANYYQGPAAGGGAAGGPFEAQIGEGTSTTGYFPFYTLYNYSIAENLFLPAELEEAGVTTAPMTSLSWYATNAPGYAQQGITIWMANVEDTELTTTSHITTGMTKVYTGSMTPEVGWNEFVFNEGSFAWDGHSSILIYCQRNNGSWNSTVYWEGTASMPFNCMSYRYQDSGAYDPTIANTMYTSTTRPNIIMKATGRRDNRDLVDFEDGNMPAGWTHYGANDSWYVDDEDYWESAPAYAGSYSLYVDGNGEYDDDYFVSPALEFAGAGAVSFAYATPDWSGDQNDLTVAYSTSPTGPWTYTSFVYQTSNSWTTANVDLSALNGTYYIAFISYDGYGYCTAIDNINITGTVNGGGGGGGVTPTPANMAYGPVITDAAVEAGTYYLVASSTDQDFEVTINREPMPCPTVDGFAFNPIPADDADEIEPASVTLQWSIPEYATGWRLVFGSTYYPDPNHPQTIIYPEDGSFSTELANSYTVRNLWNNTNYFWHVEFNNSGACPQGVSSPIWGFTTHLNVPQNLTAVDYTVFNDETITLNWSAVVDRTYRMYFVYRDGVKIGQTQVNNIGATTYTDGPLPYNMTGYSYYVTAIYDEGESAPSNTVEVKVSGRGNVDGHVYEQDGTTGIANATVTMIGQDEFGDNHTYNFTTNGQGYYSGAVYAGTYNGSAACNGYQTINEPVQGNPIGITYDQTTSPVDYILDENFDPVCAVIAEYYPDSLDPQSPYVKVYWGCGLPGSEIIEDFETGDFSMFDWQVDPTYPWSITTTNPYEGTYCMKSGGAGVANVVSNMTVTVEIPADGLMSFFGKISCENSWDYGYFYIDGVQKGSFTGAGNWIEKTYDVTAGPHTFQWRYTKDSSVNSNDDCFYVDYINFYKQPEPPIPGMTYDFEDGTMQGWTSVDADGDGYGWYMGSEIMTGQTGNNGSQDFVLSQSYYMGTVLYPDNYLVSPQVQLGGIVRFYACAQDASYAAEHFGLAVSTTNTNPSSFTMVQEWTMTAKGADSNVKKYDNSSADVNMTGMSRDGKTRAQGTWYEYTVDLSAYSGMGYVAIRHFNCSDMFYLNVDDITIGEPGAKSGENTRRFSHYRVYRTDCYNDGPYTLYDPAAGEFGNTTILSCELHDTIYIDVSWPDAAPGVYKWGVGCVYVGNRGEEYETPIQWAAPVVHRNFTTSEAAQKAPKANVEVAEQPQDRDRAYLQYSTETFSGGVGTGGGAVYWGIRFPAADLAAYAGQTLTKVGIFTDVDGDYGWTYSGNYTAMVYQGGATAPGTLVSTATEYLPGDLAWHDITLTTPVTIDATQDLWLCFYTPDIAYPMSGCDYVGNANSDFLSLDGTTWEHATSYNLDYTWMIRGFAEAGGGGGGGGGATIGLQEPRESEIVWSNCLDKDMYLAEGDVTVNVLLNSADNPEGIRVAFTNYNEAEQEMYPVEDVILDETGFYAFDSFRKGNYKVNVTFDGYEPIEDSVSIWEPTDLRYVMIEILYGIDNLYVSRTGWAMWDDSHNNPGGGGGGQGGSGDTFEFGFENGLEGWTNIDANGDGEVWYNSIESEDYHCVLEGTPHGGSHMVNSESYCNCTGALYPDNYLVSPQKYHIANGSTFTLWASGQDSGYAAEHFGVAVSTNSNTNAADFTMLQEWTLTAKDAPTAKEEIRGNRAQGTWYQKTVDLSAYAGQDVYIAIRHFNVTDQFILCIDDIALTNGAKAEANERHLEYYKVMCTSIDGEPIFNANTIHPFCQVATDALVEGEHYICKVASMYSTGMSAWEEVEWEYEPCEHWTPIEGLEVTPENEGNHLTWEFAGGGGGGGGGTGDTFTVDFDNSQMPAGWTVIDGGSPAGYGWQIGSTKLGSTGNGHNGSADLILSQSYDNNYGVIYPDNWFISPAVNLGSGSTFSFWACGQDANYAAEHCGVFVSTTGTNPSDFTMVNEWTLSAKGNGEKAAIRGNRDQGTWRQYTVELGQYAGEGRYIAIRHFNCSDMFYLDVDDLELNNGAKGTREVVAFNGFVTNPGAMANGADASWITSSQNTLGPGCQQANGNRVGDSFTLSAATTISEIEVYGYQTGSSTNSTFNGLYVQIYDGNPMSGGNVVWGDANANIMTATAFTNCYRGSDGDTGGTTRPIMSITASGLNIELAAGTYWLVYQLNGTGSSGPWGTPHAEPGIGNTGNGVQYLGSSSAWQSLTDSGTNQPFGIAMKITGNGGGGVTPTPVDGVLGFMVFRDGEWLAEILDPNAREYTDIDELDEHEYCVRVIYDGTAVLPSDNYYYAMSCPVCEGEAALCAAGGDIDITYNSLTDEVTVFWNGDTRANVVKYNVYRSSDKVTYEMIGSVASVEGRTYYEYVDAPEAGHYFYQVRAEYSNGCESEPALRLNAHEYNYVEMEVTGVDENDGMAIFPNPTKGNVTIQAAGMQHITVVSVLGQVVYDADIDADEVILNMSQYTAGMYTVRVTTDNGIRVERITVIR